MENKKGNNMWKIVLIVVLVVVVGGVALFLITNKENNDQKEKAMRMAALDYFDNYVSVNSGSSAYKITLEMLKEANDEGEEYNLKSLSGCSDEKTYATVTIDYATGKAKNTKVSLSC